MIDRYGSIDNVVGEMTKGKLLSQIFIAKENYLNYISVEFATYMRENKCRVFYELCKNGRIIKSGNIQANLLKDNSLCNFNIDCELTVGEIYELKFYSDGNFGNAVTLKYGDPIASTCIYQSVTDEIIYVPGCRCRANIVNCSNRDINDGKIKTTIGCTKKKCMGFVNYGSNDGVENLWMRLNGQQTRGQLYCVFHYGVDEDEVESNEEDVLYEHAKTSDKEVKLSIVIPTALCLDYLKSCLDSIRNHTHCSYEVILISNSPHNVYAECVKKLSSLYLNHSVIIYPNFAGYVKTCNIGAKKSIGDYICIVNDDVIVGPNWSKNLISILEKNDKIAQVGPMLAHYTKEFAFSGEKTPYPYIEGWCFIIPRHIYEEIGLFDPDLNFAYCEDSDFSTNVIAHGYNIFPLKINIKHLQTKTSHNKALKKTITKCEAQNQSYLRKKWFSK